MLGGCCGKKSDAVEEELSMDPPDEPETASEVSGGKSCSSTSRVLLFIINFLIWLGFCALVAIGIYIIVADQYASTVINQKMIMYAGVILIGVGVIGFFLTFLGCCGACIKSKCLIILYIIVMILLLVILIAAAVVGYVFNSKIDDVATAAMVDSLKMYNPNDTMSGLAKSWDLMQKSLKCCGVMNYQDWSQYNVNYQGFTINKFPASCCNNDGAIQTISIGCTTGVNTQAFYSQSGCHGQLIVLLHTYGPYVAIAGGVVAACMLIGIILGICACKRL